MHEVTLGIRSRNILQDLAQKCGVSLAMVDCRPLDRDSMAMVVELQGVPDAIDNALGEVQSLEGVKHSYVVSEAPGATRVMITMDKPGVCRASTGEAIICLDCPFNSTEVPSKWRLALRGVDDLGELLRRLSDEGIKTDVAGFNLLGEPTSPTGDDYKVITTAIREGYFEFPRRVSLNGISERANVPISIVRRVLED
jgi:hypothetical protein